MFLITINYRNYTSYQLIRIMLFQENMYLGLRAHIDHHPLDLLIRAALNLFSAQPVFVLLSKKVSIVLVSKINTLQMGEGCVKPSKVH